MNEPAFKKYLRWLLGSFALALLVLLVVNWRVDPLQFYRRASYPAFIIGEKRFQIPGIAKHYDYDAVILGTSMSENIQAKDVQEIFGWRALNLAMQGASAREQQLALEVALRTGKPRHVIWDVNWEYLRGSSDWVANYDGSFPFYFYDENSWNELGNYLLSVDTTKNTAKILLHRYQSKTPDEVFVWFNQKQFGLESFREGWRKSAAKRHERFVQHAAEYDLANLNANFDLRFLAVLRAHPDVEFKLYFPPFSLAYYADICVANPQIFSNLLANQQHVIAECRALTNVQIFDFQTTLPLVREATNYCDLAHNSHATMLQCLAAMHAGDSRATDNSPVELRSLVESSATAAWLKEVLPSP
ncbi:MAG: hypothetical protein RLZZ350_799 [Verrucomicrobiota bacterium]|jgi:hypothetical protein